MQQAVIAEQIVPEAWSLYFPDEEFSLDDRRAVLLQDLLPRLTSLTRWLAERLQPQQVTGRHRLSIGFEELQKVCSSSELSAALDLQPVEALACLGAAAHQVLFNPQAQQVLPEGIEPLKIVVRLEGHPSSMRHIRQLKSSSIGKIVSVKGTVVRISAVKPLIQCMTFTCTRCGGEHQMRFPEGIYTPPTGCNLDGCRSKSFKPQKKSAQSLDWQKIRIQELSQADKEEAGRVPRTLEVELTRDLVDSCSAGDLVTVLGIVKVLSTDAEAGGKGSKGTAGKRSLFLLYLDAVSVVNQRGANQSCKDTTDQISQPIDHLPSHQATSFTLRDLHFIVKFAQEYKGQQLKQLVHALCPAIYGHELVKAGVVLALFGGVRKGNDDLASVPVRGDIHCLIVGDPGIGKSQLLKAASAAAPRGLYVCGPSSSSAGLTATVVRDPLTGAFALEAGALVLADRGVCCVDEFDKITAEHQALLGPLEQQEVCVAKAGLVASLPARTSLLAAANPAGGQYNRAKTLLQNLKMSAAMLSRFDIIFVLLDQPDQRRDEHLSEHVMAMHSGQGDRVRRAHQGSFRTRPPASLAALDPTTQQPSLEDRLKMYSGEAHDPLPMQLLQKYIAYARQYCHPVLSDDAKQVLKEYYCKLRQASLTSEGTPVTARQLESLIRMAEARARLELVQIVTAQHAQEVIEISSESMRDVQGAAAGASCLDFRVPGGSRAGSKQAEARRFLSALGRRAEQSGNAFSVHQLFDLSDHLQLKVPDMRDFIDQLNEAGMLC
ncbi:TPA: DNA replication licensing factor mcm8, variant 3 [Trebouxia sp. C0005]